MIQILHFHIVVGFQETDENELNNKKVKHASQL